MWEETHTKILEALKAEVKDNTILQYFYPQKEIVIECDASQKGLGACILQDGKPVNFSSRSLIDAEMRYCNLEHEMLAVAWAVNHYNFCSNVKATISQSNTRVLRCTLSDCLLR